MMTEEQAASIRAKAEALAGETFGEEAEMLVAACASIARALCCREDIPEDMEAVVARMVLLARRQDADGVKSVTRGDTSIAYETGAAFQKILDQLSPFRRLGRLRREEA